MNPKSNFKSLDKEIKIYLQQIKILMPLGAELLDNMRKEQPIQRENIIIYAFLRKVVRLLVALVGLIKDGFEEEGQILVRVIIETKISFEYFLSIANEDFNKAFSRVIDATRLEKKKQLKSTKFLIGKKEIDEEKWNKIEEEIKIRYSDQDFKNLNKWGFSGLSLKACAEKTDNDDYYNYAYRLYSKHVHMTDIAEQLQDILTPEVLPRYSRTRILSLLQAAFNCSLNVIDKCNKWLGKPIKMPVEI